MNSPKAHHRKSKKQPIDALSICKAEYIALAKATQENLYLTKLLNEMDPLKEYAPVKIFGDNLSAKYHYTRDALPSSINIIYCPTTNMLADIMTKPPTRAKLKKKKYIKIQRTFIRAISPNKTPLNFSVFFFPVLTV